MKRKHALAIIAIAAGLIIVLSNTTVEAVREDRAHTFETSMHPPAGVSSILNRACYNCHSNETRWPWYSYIPPLNWMIRSDVQNARSVLNFSDWSTQAGATPRRAAAMLTTSCAAVQAGLMPKTRYLLLHPEARLSASEQRQLCEWTHLEARQLIAQPR